MSGPPVDLLVVGAGLAGVLVAEGVRRRAPHRAITMVHDPRHASGSHTPLALCHALPGRSLRYDDDTARAFAKTRAAFANDPAARPLDIVRALHPGHDPDRMRRTFEQSRDALGRDGFAPRVISPDAVGTVGLSPAAAPGGALVYGAGFSIPLGRVLEQRRRALVAAGVQLRPAVVHEVIASSGPPAVRTSAGHLVARHIVLAAGTGLSTLCPEAGLDTEAGALAVCAPVSLPGAYAGGTFLAPAHDGTVALGSTHQPAHAPRDDDDATRALRRAAARLRPDLDLRPRQVFWGERAFARSRRPVVDEVRPGVFVCGGFGGGGLLRAPAAADRVVDALLRAGG